METCAFIVFPCVFNLSPVWSFGDFMSAKFLLAHYFCLSPLPSVTYRCLKLFLIKQKNAFCGQKFPLSGDMTSQRLVVTRDDPNITESFLTWDSAKMKRNRERKGGERKWQRKKERNKERKKEGMWEKARRFIPLLRNAALQRAQSAIHLWLRDEIVWLRLVSVLNDTQRRCHRDNFGKMKKSILKVNRALPAGGSRAATVALFPRQVNVSFLQILLLRRSTIVNLYLLVHSPGD